MSAPILTLGPCSMTAALAARRLPATTLVGYLKAHARTGGDARDEDEERRTTIHGSDSPAPVVITTFLGSNPRTVLNLHGEPLP